MNDIAIPTIPAGILLLLNFFSPYATAVVISPRWSAAQKKIAAIVVSLLLTAVVLLVSWWLGAELPSWPVLFLLAVVVSQASYALVTKQSADALASSTGTGSSGPFA
jgi:L-lactate permease